MSVSPAARLEIIASWLAVAIAFALPLSTSATNVLFIAAPVLFWCAGRWREKWAAIWQRRGAIGLLLLFLLMLIGVSYSTAPFAQATDALLKNDRLIWGLLLLPIFLQAKWRHYALHAFFAALVITLVMAVLIKIGLVPQGKSTPMLLFKDRIQTSFLLAICAYFAASCYLFSAAIVSSVDGDATAGIQYLPRWSYGLLALLCTLMLFSMDGRSGYFVFFPLLLLLCWSRWHWRGLLFFALLSTVILGAAYSFSPAFKGRMAEAGENVQAYQEGDSTTSVGLRMQFAKNSLAAVKQHPVFGTGTGSFEQSYASVVTDPKQLTHNPHNEYLNFLVQWGAVGLAVLFFVLCLQWRDSYRLPIPMQQVVQGTIVALLVGCLANSWLMDTTEGHFYAYFIALAFAGQVQLRPLFGKVEV
jgi:O-antigen ligase